MAVGSFFSLQPDCPNQPCFINYFIQPSLLESLLGSLQEVFIKMVGWKLPENIKGVDAGPSDGIERHHSVTAAQQGDGLV